MFSNIGFPNQIISTTKILADYLLKISKYCIAYFHFYYHTDYNFVKKLLAQHTFVIDIASSFLAFEINSEVESRMFENWGNYDLFELIFYDEKPRLDNIDYNNYFQRNKSFIESIDSNKTVAIISDSGDGAEVEVIVKKEMQMEILNIL